MRTYGIARLSPVLSGTIFVALTVLTLGGRGAPAQVAPATAGQSCLKSGCHDGYAKCSTPHQPVAEQTCEACHEETDAEKHRWKLTAQEPELCAQCHEGIIEGIDFLHGPVAAGACSACHDPHGSNHDAILIAQGGDLCFQCHDDIQERLKEADSKHAPATEECTSCHLPHGGPNKMFTRAASPGLCFECHEDVQKAMSDATVGHKAMTAERSCLSCHDPHASPYSGVLVKESMELCMVCHAEDIGAEDKKVRGIGTLLEEKTNHHGPIRQKDCASCHPGVHGGEHFRLLAADYPARFYAVFDEKLYALCFECHEGALVRDAKTTELTGFRNGDQNLHFVHVNRKKGRTCRSCHNTHASDNPAHITESVPFGRKGWALPLKFSKTDTGGSCAPGCHKAYDYDRNEPAVNLPPRGGQGSGQ